MVAPVGKIVGKTIVKRPSVVYSLITEGETDVHESEVVELGWGEWLQLHISSSSVWEFGSVDTKEDAWRFVVVDCAGMLSSKVGKASLGSGEDG